MVFSREEVWRILHLVRLPVYRVCLITIYACGLRLLEGARLRVIDVDSARLVLHVQAGARRSGAPASLTDVPSPRDRQPRA